MDEIKSFSGEYEFLSNFYEIPIHYKYIFRNAEAAYQAQKAVSSDDKIDFTKYNAAKAKRKGRKIELRPDWEEVKVSFMKDIVFAKFFQNPDLAARLLKTEDATLIEGNDWHDTFWGVDLKTGEGQNNLGKILMETREELKNPEISMLNNKNAVLTRFAAPELVIFDWMPPKTTFCWPLGNLKEVHLNFERIYKISRKDRESFDGISDFVWQFHGRIFYELNFLLGKTIKKLRTADRDSIREIREHDDGEKFFYQATKVPTFDEFDDKWDGINEFIIFRDEKGIHLIQSQHGYEIPEVTIYTGLKNSPPLLKRILKHLN